MSNLFLKYHRKFVKIHVPIGFVIMLCVMAFTFGRFVGTMEAWEIVHKVLGY